SCGRAPVAEQERVGRVRGDDRLQIAVRAGVIVGPRDLGVAIVGLPPVLVALGLKAVKVLQGAEAGDPAQRRAEVLMVARGQDAAAPRMEVEQRLLLAWGEPLPS